MRFSTEPENRKYVKGYGFFIAKRFRDKYGNKLMGTATKTGVNAAKTDSKKGCSKNCRSDWRFDWK